MAHTQRTRQVRHTTDSSQIAHTAHTFSSAAYLAKLMGELDRAAICARIQQAREEAGLTQPELADAMNTHFRTIQTWESVKRPRVPWDRLDEIARLTGRTKEWLLHAEKAIPDGDHLAELEAKVDDLTRQTTAGFALLDRRLGRLEQQLLPLEPPEAQADEDG